MRGGGDEGGGGGWSRVLSITLHYRVPVSQFVTLG